MLRIRRQNRQENDQNQRVDTMGTHVYSSTDQKSLHKSLNGEFLLYQILLEQLLDENQKLMSYQGSLIEYFQPDETADKKVMEEFDKKYRPEKAIHWYTRETCIYKILNKALRTQDVDSIVPFESFIRDINAQLNEEHKLFVQRQKDKSSIEIYRGQFISKDEIKSLQRTKDQLISMNSFLSTSTKKEKALEFATSHPPPNNDLTTILLIINANLKCLTKPYADIKDLSAFPGEAEVLFMFGSIFRLKSISYDEKLKIWIAKLDLCSLDDPDVKTFRATLEKESHEQNAYISLGNYFIQMLQYDDAQEHFQNVLDRNLAQNNIELAYCHLGLGQALFKKEDFNSAKLHLNKAIKYLTENSSSTIHKLLSTCYYDLGVVYVQENNTKLAFESFEKALSTNNKDNLSKIYGALSNLHFKMTNYHIALEYAEKSLKNQSETDYTLIASTYIDMGKIYTAMNEKQKASEMFGKATESQLKALPENHPDVSYIYNACGLMYSEINDYDKAQEYFEKAQQLSSASLPDKHPDFADSYKNFATLNMKKGDIDKALYYYEKVLDNQLKTLNFHSSSVLDTCEQIGDIHWKKRNYDQAFEYLLKILKSRTETHKKGAIGLSNIYKKLGDLSLDKQNLHEALDYYQKLLDNESETKLCEDMSLAEIYKTIAQIYYKQRHLDQSLIYYNRLLDCYFNQKPVKNEKLDEIFDIIGKIYLKNHDIDETLMFYNKTRQDKTSMLDDETTANIYFEKRHLEHSLNYFKTSLQKLLEKHKEKDPILVKYYEILGKISYEKQNYEDSLKYFHQLLDNELQRKPMNDRSLRHSYKSIAIIYFQQGNYSQSLVFLNRLIDCQLQKLTSEHPDLNKAYAMVAKVYLRKNNLDLNSNYLNKLINNEFNNNLYDKTSSNLMLAGLNNVEFERHYLDQALVYFRNLINQPMKNISIVETYTIVGNICLEKHDYNQALTFFQALRQLLKTENSIDYAKSAETYFIIGNIHAQISHYQEASHNYQKALKFYQQMTPVNQSLLHKLQRKINRLPISR